MIALTVGLVVALAYIGIRADPIDNVASKVPTIADRNNFGGETGGRVKEKTRLSDIVTSNGQNDESRGRR